MSLTTFSCFSSTKQVCAGAIATARGLSGQQKDNRQVKDWAKSIKGYVSLSTNMSFATSCRLGWSCIVTNGRRTGAGTGLLECAQLKVGGRLPA